MKRVYAALNCCLFAILLSCSDIQNSKVEKMETSVPTNNLLDHGTNIVIQDTSKPANLRELINPYTKKMDSIDKLRTSAYKNSKSKTQLFRDSIQRMEEDYHSLLEKRNAAIYNYTCVNEKKADNLEGILYLVVDKKIPITIIDSLFKKFPLAQQNSKLGRLLIGKIDERKDSETILSYDPAILDPKFEDQNGKYVNLNQINSSFILLDFWASWCAPCRYENRILVNEKEKILGNADVSIVAVSLDTDKDKWLKATKEDSLSYLTICDFKAMESPLTKAFKIKTVPYNVLIDKKGKILARNLWGDNLSNFLKTMK